MKKLIGALKKLPSALMVILVVYTIGIIVGLLFLVLKWTGKIKIINPENFPRLRSKMLFVSNHPDLLNCMFEVFLLPALLFPRYLLHPFKLSPWFSPDKRNFTSKWYWGWIRPRAVAVERGNRGSELSAIRGMHRILSNHRGIIIHFPEGGRTCTGKKFLQSKNRKKKIRILKDSIGWLILKTQVPVFPVWVENGENNTQCPTKNLFSWPRFNRGPIIIKFGKLMRFTPELGAMNASQLTDIIALNLLRLADQ